MVEVDRWGFTLRHVNTGYALSSAIDIWVSAFSGRS
jgi:hypothetical protein